MERLALPCSPFVGMGMVLMGILFLVRGKTRVIGTSLSLEGWLVRIAGGFLLLPLLSLLALSTYDPMLFPAFYFPPCPVCERWDHIYYRAGWLISAGMAGMALALALSAYMQNRARK